MGNNENTAFCLVLEDQKETQQFLCQWIATHFSSYEVVAFASFQTACQWSRDNPQADLRFSFIDLALPDGNGLDFIKILKQNYPSNQNYVITIFDDHPNLFQALRYGADGYILKESDSEVMRQTLRKIIVGEPPLSPVIAKKMLGHFYDKGASQEQEVKLTPREEETLTLIAHGMTVPEIATQLSLSPQTVAGYIKNVYHKLHISNRVEATHEAIKRGLI